MAADLVKRDFSAPRPNTVWVADFTYVHAWCGIVYAFVVDVYSWAIAGWAASVSKRAGLVLDALDMALWRRERIGRPVEPGLIHHSDAGSQGEHRLDCQRVRCRPTAGRNGRAPEPRRAHSTGSSPPLLELERVA
ncbi:DDE-type integrase/transposase/recombinase [Nonomuraea basaltis]|nr:DDE-type integrase/transposase/recombinase [Nonomuraea basaltis]